ncbi:MAG: hypothetical protein K9N46_00940 [Candidatus Marinimicrobia bacterium]|nr:hypothetical protein [Candidatus Neomarinimicrobiota bacterium]MCF7827957.1 hypothetical protein [Candidatus Neomarinimicrobiota bacterium]MCF7879288.1 hypothetical protein [Candidatus Neomarinimicrobiota bacterium]
MDYSKRISIVVLFACIAGISLYTCEGHNVDIQDVTLDGVVYQTTNDFGVIMDVRRLGSPMYGLDPMVNGVPMTNIDRSERYVLEQTVAEFRHDSTYTMEVSIQDRMFVDSVTTPGDFRIYTDGADTIHVLRGAEPRPVWSMADSVSRYMVELVYIEGNGEESVQLEADIGPDTTYTLPLMDVVGVYRFSVYAYHNSVYHPGKGYMKGYTTPSDWVIDGAWSAWVRRSIVYWVTL